MSSVCGFFSFIPSSVIFVGRDVAPEKLPRDHREVAFPRFYSVGHKANGYLSIHLLALLSYISKLLGTGKRDRSSEDLRLIMRQLSGISDIDTSPPF